MSEIFFFDPPLSDNLIQVERIYSNSKITREIEYFKNGTTKVINSNETPSAKTNKSLEMSYGQDMSFVYAILLLLLVPIFLIFKTSIRKKTLKRNIPRKKTRTVSSQQNFSSFNFWQGQKGLVLTFWGFFVGGNILFNAATMILADNPNLLIFNFVFFVIWNVLSVIGVFNAADIYKAEKIKQGLPYTAATIAKVAVVLLILSAIGNNIPR
jgi:TRAP-type C4-dicarboxylate transport system permease small subunit